MSLSLGIDKDLLDLSLAELRAYLSDEIGPEEFLWRLEGHRLHTASMKGEKYAAPKKITVHVIYERSL